MNRAVAAIFALSLLTAAIPAQAAWLEGGWVARRAIDVNYDPAKSIGDEIASVRFYTGGLHEPGGENIRVTGEDGRPVPAQVLMLGPGDQMRIAFAAQRGPGRYYVYFGHPNAPPMPKVLEMNWRCGLMLDMRHLEDRSASAATALDLQKAWQDSPRVVGRMLVDQLFSGSNPFDETVSVIARYSGQIFLQRDGEYVFAAGASDRGALFIDGKPLMYVPSFVGDVRFNQKITLRRGKHDIDFYLLNRSGEIRLSVAWKLPGFDKFELVPAAAFGTLPLTTAGPMEVRNRRFVADMSVEYLGECFYEDHYSHRYRFTAPANGQGVACEWDFGDGQTATGASVEHVFLADGIYAVTLKQRSGVLSDSLTNRIAVSRCYERIANPPGDNPPVQARIVAEYQFEKLPPASLKWAVYLLERARQLQAVQNAAIVLASTGSGADAIGAIALAADALTGSGDFPAAAKLWQAASRDPFQPQAARRYAELLLWRMGEIDKAIAILAPQSKRFARDQALQRTYAHALLLGGKLPEAGKILSSLPAESSVERRFALAGAQARTIEYYIRNKELAAGEAAWEKWQQQCPADFLDGYSVLLRTELMELADAPAAAARIAEAFALAVPQSSYSPRLLDRASKLLARSDPEHSDELRQLLKQKYPENPLSQ